jgi:hypothetical protein
MPAALISVARQPHDARAWPRQGTRQDRRATTPTATAVYLLVPLV